MAESAPASPGSRLGRWRLGGVIGEGATARVFEARHVDVPRRAAVKVLRAAGALDPVARERFAREADAAARVRHPGVVPLLDAGVEGDVVYVVMDLVEGEPLAALLAREGRLAPRRVARLGRDLAAGLAAVHRCGVIHRDVKPANVVLTAAGEGDRPVLVDFGAAWLEAPRPEVALTMRGELVGTPAYMAPEQASGVELDARADVYALGVVLYECLAGRRPFDAPTWQATLLAAARGRPPALRSLRPEVPAALDRVVRRAMAPDREARYPDADSLRAALDDVLAPAAPARWRPALAVLGCLAVGVVTVGGGPARPVAVVAEGRSLSGAPPARVEVAPQPAAEPAPGESNAPPSPPRARRPSRRRAAAVERGTRGAPILPHIGR